MSCMCCLHSYLYQCNTKCYNFIFHMRKSERARKRERKRDKPLETAECCGHNMINCYHVNCTTQHSSTGPASMSGKYVYTHANTLNTDINKAAISLRK